MEHTEMIKNLVPRKGTWKALLLLTALFLFAVMPTVSSAAWTIEAVDAPKYFTNFYQRAIAIDSSGRPHIAYGGDHLYHAYFDGMQWQYEVVDGSSGVGQYASIAMDSNNRVHISYYANYDLKYATNASGSWVIETIDSVGSVGRFTSIAIDSNNRVHISYYDYTNYDIKYATNTTGSWITSTIDSEGYVGEYTSIAIDSNNKVHISYHDYTNYDLEYATNASGSWVTETLDSEGYVGWYTSIAVDSNDKVHISYYDWTNGNLKYATNATGSWMIEWVIETIDSEGYVGRYTSIAIDSNNKVHISYHDWTNDDLKYATNTTGSWITETVDSEGYVGEYTSIAIDSNDRVHISYYDPYDVFKGNLKYVTNVTGSWIIETVDSRGVIGGYTSIAVDSIGNVHISYMDERSLLCELFPCPPPPLAFPSLRYASNMTGVWVTETVKSEGPTGWNTAFDTSIAVDSSGNAHIGYLDWIDLDPKYATNATGSWITETVESAGGWDTSIAIDSDDNLHISYVEGYPNYDLKYATNASGSWVSTIIDSNMVWAIAIAIDSNDRVHISYSGSGFKYATNATGSWVIETVDSEGGVGEYTSIAIDSNDKVHISYWDWTNDDLKYATNATDSWVISTIDSEGSVGEYTSIAVDSNDSVHISYFDGSNRDLKYTTNATGSWVTSTIDSEGSVGWDTSIAIDSNNGVHISYFDLSNSDLKYATTTCITSFTDVPTGHWAEGYIEAIFCNDITTAYGDGTYRPTNTVTRAQMAAFIIRAVEGEPAADYCGTTDPFPDVPYGDWACKYIKRLVELGITTGCGGGDYCPDDSVTRKQIAAYIIRAVEGEPAADYCGTTDPFPDVPYGDWACKYIKRLVELAITTGCGGGDYCPDDNTTRAQIAAFLARAFLGIP